jgi:hypothetical protein
MLSLGFMHVIGKVCGDLHVGIFDVEFFPTI